MRAALAVAVLVALVAIIAMILAHLDKVRPQSAKAIVKLGRAEARLELINPAPLGRSPSSDIDRARSEGTGCQQSPEAGWTPGRDQPG